MAGRYGLHCGVLYTIEDAPPRVLHLRWHLQLVVDTANEAWWLVPSRLTRAQKNLVIVCAGKVANMHRDGAVPYGLSLDGVSIDKDGRIDLAGQVGLTCAAFVQVLHASVNAPLVALSSWDEREPHRKREDDAIQAQLARDLASDGHAQQARRVASQIGATRLRSEEVAAASGMPHRPVEYHDVQPHARAVVDALATQIVELRKSST